MEFKQDYDDKLSAYKLKKIIIHSIIIKLLG